MSHRLCREYRCYHPSSSGCTHHSLRPTSMCTFFQQDRRIFIDLTDDARASSVAATTRRTRLAVSSTISRQLVLPPPRSDRAEDLMVRGVGVDLLSFLKQGTEGRALGAMGPIDSSEWAQTARRHRWLFQVLFTYDVAIYGVQCSRTNMRSCHTCVSCSVKECVTRQSSRRALVVANLDALWAWH